MYYTSNSIDTFFTEVLANYLDMGVLHFPCDIGD